MSSASDVLGDERSCHPTSEPDNDPKTDPLTNPKLPWDVIERVIKHADRPTLPAISLVCRDLLMDSAPTLCRRATISVLHTPAWGEGLSALQIQTEALKKHTRRKHIKHIRLHLRPSKNTPKNNPLNHPAARDRFIDLFLAVQLLELEIFELNSDLQPELEHALHNIALPTTLSELHIYGHRFTKLHKLEDSFWRRHAPHLTSLTLHSPLDIAESLGGYPVPFPRLKRLHAYEYGVLVDINAQENTLKHLVIKEVFPPEIDALYKALTDEPSTTMRLPTTLPAVATLERFEFSYSGDDPSEMYTDIIAHMPQLQWLKGKHPKFPSPDELGETAEALLKLEHLKFFEWTTTDYEPGLVVAKYSSFGAMVEIGFPGHMNDSEDEWSDSRYEEEEDEWMAFASLITECRSLCRLVYRRRSRRSGADITKIVITRKGYGHGWSISP